MISMTKNDIVRYLSDYSNIIYISMHNPNLSIGKIFDRYMIENNRLEDCNIEYYDRMRRVYIFYSIFRYFSFFEDYLLNRDDFISNNDLNGLEQGAQFYSNISGITNKRIVQLLRNAFNHNDSSFERFKLSVNGKYCEIEFKDIRTPKEKSANIPIKPFKMKFDKTYVLKVMDKLHCEALNCLVISFEIPDSFDILSDNLYEELKKIKIIRYYFPQKLSHTLVNKLFECSTSTDSNIDERSEKMHLMCQEQKHLVGRYALNDEQVKKVAHMVQWYRNNNVNDSEMLENKNFYMYYFLMKVVPIPLLKAPYYNKQAMIAECFLLDTNCSYNDIQQKIKNLFIDGIPSNYDEIDVEIHNDLLNKYNVYSTKMKLYMDINDGEFYYLYSLISYIDAVVTHLCNDNILEIDGMQYSREKIRNSFVHGRWFISKNHEIIMYDADPKNINDYNLEYIAKINIASFKFWADEYMIRNRIKKGRFKN